MRKAGWQFTMEVYTVSRDDSVYECFPDLALIDDGRLICVYRESEAHTPVSSTRIVVRASADEGRTWGPRHLIAQTRGSVQTVPGWNCPRIARLPDGRIVIACDSLLWPEGRDLHRRSQIHLWWSDDGQIWRGPEATGVTGIVPDRPTWTPRGLLMGTHDHSPRTGGLRQLLWSQEGSGVWSGPVTVAEEEGMNLCEGSLVRGDGIWACLMRENSGRGLPGQRSVSRDPGGGWEGPFPTPLPGCHRPVAGWWGKEVLVTYRCHMGRGAKNTLLMGAVMDAGAAFSPQAGTGNARIFPIDYDRSPHPDTGYSGWAVLADGSIYVINYICDDAPKAQIRGYRLYPEDVELVEPRAS